jgi:hypothetical protein
MAPEAAPPRAAGSTTGARRLPTFLIIGANKSGTTSLYRYLQQHPQVYLPAVKEPHYFTYRHGVPGGEDNRERTLLLPPEAGELRTLDDYAGLFADARPEQVALGEASTGYLCGPAIPAAVRQALPDVRLVALLRDPADRAWSEFLMMRRLGQEGEASLLKILETRDEPRYVANGRYAAALTRWLGAFPRERLFLARFADFTRDTATVVRDIVAFIGADPATRIDTSGRFNTRNRREPTLDARTRAALIERLGPDIEQLEGLLDWDLSSWKTVRLRRWASWQRTLRSRLSRRP